MQLPSHTMSSKQQKIEALRQKEEQLKKQRKLLEKQIAKEGRKKDTKQKVLIGAAILDCVAKGKNGWTQEKLLKLMDAFLIRDGDRSIFELDPKPDIKKAKAAKSASTDTSSTEIQSVPNTQEAAIQATASETTKAVMQQENPSQKTDSKRLAEPIDRDLEKEFF